MSTICDANFDEIDNQLERMNNARIAIITRLKELGHTIYTDAERSASQYANITLSEIPDFINYIDKPEYQT